MRTAALRARMRAAVQRLAGREDALDLLADLPPELVAQGIVGLDEHAGAEVFISPAVDWLHPAVASNNSVPELDDLWTALERHAARIPAASVRAGYLHECRRRLEQLLELEAVWVPDAWRCADPASRPVTVALVAWHPAAPDRWEIIAGDRDQAVLGIIPPYRQDVPLHVWRSPHAWLRSGCRGVCFLTRDRVSIRSVLSIAGGVIAEDRAHMRELRGICERPLEAPRIRAA